MVLRREYEDGVPPLGGITAFCERLTESLGLRIEGERILFVYPSPGESLGLRIEGERIAFVDPSPGDACDDFRGVATFQPWDRVD